MSVATGLPAPAQNRTTTGFLDAASDLAVADILVTAGDFTGGTPEDEFNLTAHGLVKGDYVFLLYKDANGVVTGSVGTKFRVTLNSADSFCLTTLAGVTIENTADGTAVFLKGSHRTPDTVVQNVILPRLVFAQGDFTGGTAEDMFRPSIITGTPGIAETNSLKLYYKSAAGVLTGISAGTTVFAKDVTEGTTAYFRTADTSGGSLIENTADGLAIFLKTT
jgi:hypothetical protein